MIIVTSKVFDKKFAKLTRQVQLQAKERIILFAQDRAHPLLRDHTLHGEMKEFRSFSVNGDVRIVYEKTTKTTVRFLDIGTHSDIYGT